MGVDDLSANIKQTTGQVECLLNKTCHVDLFGSFYALINTRAYHATAKHVAKEARVQVTFEASFNPVSSDKSLKRPNIAPHPPFNITGTRPAKAPNYTSSDPVSPAQNKTESTTTEIEFSTSSNPATMLIDTGLQNTALSSAGSSSYDQNRSRPPIAQGGDDGGKNLTLPDTDQPEQPQQVMRVSLAESIEELLLQELKGIYIDLDGHPTVTPQ
ncbi:MAG: hypothetical protein J3R72DRAFT_524361 [Linnemannia gamsii]|nr:MAG: hypothetical protein J3R72DRAFT_524361 [Linnemannia gamsii]